MADSANKPIVKLNGNVTAALLTIILTSTITWGAYITKHLADQTTQIAVLEQKLDHVQDTLGQLLKRLALPLSSR